MHIVNGRIRVSMDPMTGAVSRVVDSHSGLVHIDATSDRASDRRLLRVIAPGADWSSRYADGHLEQGAEVIADGSAVRVLLPDLLAATGERLGTSAECHAYPSSAPDEVLFTVRLENHGQHTVNEVRFPWFGGWRGYAGKGRDRMTVGARHFADPHGFPTSVGNSYALNHQRLTVDYPVGLCAPWIDVSGPEGGLSLSNYMPRPENGALSIENLAGYGPGLVLALGWSHRIVLRPGETWTSPPIGIAVHAGDWHETADRYRAWFGARKATPARTSLGTKIGFQNVFFRGFDGTPIRPLEDILRVAEIGRSYGVDHLCVWDAPTLGNYVNSGPGDLTDYEGAARAALKLGLAQAGAAGIDTSALINFRHPPVSLRLGDPTLQREVQHRYDGTARTENWCGSHNHAGLWTKHLGPESYVFSPFSEEHRQRVLELTREYLDLGYCSMFYDQPFEVHPDYGFIDDGMRPEHTHEHALTLIAQVRELLLARNAEAIIIGEECDIFAIDCVDMWMSWRISDPSVAKDVAITRYSIPDTTISWVVDSDPSRAALAFALGMHLCLMVHGGEGTLADEPELARLVGALARLRRTTAERTTLARFNNQLGITIDADETMVAYSYDSPAGPAVIAAAPARASAGSITVERSAFTNPGGQEASLLHRLDGTTTPAPGDTQQLHLEANEVAVWVL